MDIQTMEANFKHVADEIKKVEAWAKENENKYFFDDFHDNIVDQLVDVQQFAKENNVPMVVTAESIARKFYDDTDGYSEDEESSSEYEEESSSEW